jgi:hypothetical protein
VLFTYSGKKMKNSWRITIALLFGVTACHLSGQQIRTSDPKVYNPDSIKAVSVNLSIPSAYGKVVIEQYDKLIDLIFLPSPPCPP